MEPESPMGESLPTTAAGGTEESANKRWMRLALEEARQAAREGEVPIGAVTVLDGRLLSREHNRSLQLNDPSAHAEILALRRAGELLGNYRLKGVELYCTIEPCPMCAGAAVWARLERVVFGARDEKAGAVVSKARLFEPGLLNHDVPFEEGVLAGECAEVMRRFFLQRR